MLTENSSNHKQGKKIYRCDDEDIKQAVLPERQVGVNPNQIKQRGLYEQDRSSGYRKNTYDQPELKIAVYSPFVF